MLNKFKRAKPPKVELKNPVTTIRQPSVIQQEYLQLVQQLGELQFQLMSIPERQEQLKAKIVVLDEEFGEAQKHAAEQAKKASEAADKLKQANAQANATQADAGVTSN